MGAPFGHTPSTKGKGKGATWIKAHVSHQDPQCLRWPFSYDRAHGRGRLGYLGKIWWAHRLMCLLAHGEPPTPKHQATHSCGNGHMGCVNPRHLEWKTNSENQLERTAHGSPVGQRFGNRTPLTPAQVQEIRLLKGLMTQFKIADRFGIKRGVVEYWQRTTHNPVPPSMSAKSQRRRRRIAA